MWYTFCTASGVSLKGDVVMKKHLSKVIFAVFILAYVVCCFMQAPITDAVGSMWSLLPPIVAIGLALITKEVYSSLFIGIVTGGMVYADGLKQRLPGNVQYDS